MLHLKELVLFLLTCLLSFEIVVWAGNEDTKPMGEPLRFETPKMTEEEQHSQHMPANLICDACTAVAYQVSYTHIFWVSQKNVNKFGKK